MKNKMNGKQFLHNVLNGAALGIIVGVLPNPIVSNILRLLPESPLVTAGLQAALIYQMATPIFIGALVALQFKFTPLRVAVVAGAGFLGSGVVRFNADLGAFVGAGAGDILSTMFTAALASFLLLLIGKKFGSAEIVFCSMLVGVGSGVVGMLAFPHISAITTAIGHGINTFTALHPFPMSILLGMSSAFIILSPLSTVAIGLAIQLTGVASGAFSMGVAAVSLSLVVHSWKVNEAGVTLAAGLGAMKMFMPNLIKYPVILVPVFFTAAISALPVALLNISGNPMSSGFGIIGLVGPLTAMEYGLSLPLTLLSWFVVPVAASIASMVLFNNVLKVYKKEVVFAFTVEEKKVTTTKEKAVKPLLKTA